MKFWQTLRLRTDIALWRYGWQWLALLAVLLGNAVVYLGWMRQQEQALVASKQALESLEREQTQRLKTPAPVVTVSDDVRVAEQLARITYAPADVSIAVQLIQQMARAKGIVLAQSEFQTSNEGHGGLRQIQITLPLRCSYPQLRDLSTSLMRQMPGISLDQIALKRENVAQSQADIRLKLSIWVDPSKAPSQTRPEPQKFEAVSPSRSGS